MNADTKFMIASLATASALAVVIILLPLVALQPIMGDGPIVLVPAILLSVVWLAASFKSFALIDHATRR